MGKLRHLVMSVSDPRKTAAYDKSVAAWGASVKPIRGWPQRRVDEGCTT